MADIVERLRQRPWRSAAENDYEAKERRQREREEGADEITALRAENERLKIENIQMQAALGYGILAEDERHILPSNPFKCGTCDASKHLRAEVEDLGNRLHHVHRLWANNEHALRAEVEKLKAALRVYAGPVGGDDFPHWSEGYPGGVMVEWNAIDFGDAARAALGDTP